MASPKQAATYKPTTTTTKGFYFLDLPPEIRNMIYSLLLESQSPIDIYRRRRARRDPLPDKELIDGILIEDTSDDDDSHYDYDPHNDDYHVSLWRRTGHSDDDLHVNILQTNHHIHAEATPILYSMNTFSFTKAAWSDLNLLLFLKLIGRSRTFVRHISLGYFHSRTRMRSALHLLKAAKMLQIFELSHRVLRHNFEPEPDPVRRANRKRKRSKSDGPRKNIEALLPWLRSLRKARLVGGDKRSVLQVLTLQDVPRDDKDTDEQ